MYSCNSRFIGISLSPLQHNNYFHSCIPYKIKILQRKCIPQWSKCVHKMSIYSAWFACTLTKDISNFGSSFAYQIAKLQFSAKRTILFHLNGKVSVPATESSKLQHLNPFYKAYYKSKHGHIVKISIATQYIQAKAAKSNLLCKKGQLEYYIKCNCEGKLNKDLCTKAWSDAVNK